jgi:D-arabinonate dehydratase
MRIAKVTSAIYSKPYERPISNGKYTYTASTVVVVKVTTDEGLTGIGWAGGGSIVNETVKQLGPYVVGEDPFNVERIWDKMYLPKIFGRKGLTTRAISAVDIAIWDVIGKAVGKPLYQMLGGYREVVPAYIAGGYYEEGKGMDGLRREMETNLELGAKAIKMKVGRLSLKEDEKRVKAVREVIGDEIDLLVDANNAYNTYQATQMAHLLEDYDAYWFEEPLSPDNISGSAEVATASDVPIATGENEYTRWGFRDLIEARAADIINPDAQVLGGITEFRKVADLASAYEIPVAPHGSQEVHVHLVAAIPNGLIVEFYEKNTNSLSGIMFKESLKMKDGHVSPPDRPGIGVELNEKALEPYRVG